MINLIKDIFSRFRNLILYGIIGTFTASLDFLVFSLLFSWYNVHYIIANCLSVLVGITTSFILNRKYNFKVKDKPLIRFSMFLVVGLSGLCLSNLILWLGIDKLHSNETLAKFASIVLVVAFQFLLNKFVTFRKELHE